MRTAIIVADRFNPVRRWFWQKPDGLHALEAGGLVRCVVLHQENGATLPGKPDPYHAMARIVRLIGKPFYHIKLNCERCGGGQCRINALSQRVEFDDP